MKIFLLLSTILLALSCTTKPLQKRAVSQQEPTQIQEEPTKQALATPAYHYTVDVRDGSRNRFYVTLQTGPLSAQNSLLIFAAVGAFGGVDFRNYIENISAFDGQGNTIAVNNDGPYIWRISAPERVSYIQYEVRGSWDMVFDPQVYPMAGTVVKRRFSLINGKGIFAIISGLENKPFDVRLRFPQTWSIGTALPFINDTTLYCKNFSIAVSTPILMGEISTLTDKILGMDVALHTFSASDRTSSEDLYEPVNDVIRATYDFMGELPASTATMLFIFDDKHAGGVQFRKSSAFVFKDDPFTNIRQRVQDVIAHEFFHLFIPFSIRSDALEDQSLFKARPSGHLWFFEGVTEWASDMLQVHAGLKEMGHYLGRDFRDKLFQEDFFPGSVSLYKMSRQRQRKQNDYLSVYSRGALVAALFDIHLLDRTFGNRGLRDVLRDLHIDYGADRPLPEDRFFEILQEYSGPEFEDFIENYIVGIQPLPVKEVLATIGLNYEASKVADNGEGDPGIVIIPGEKGLEIVWVDERRKSDGLQRGDIVLELDRQRITPANLDALLERVRQRPIGSSFDLRIKRNRKRFDITLQSLPFHFRHVMTFPRNISPAQQNILRRWQGLDN